MSNSGSGWANAGTASLSDLLTAAKNIVTAINGLTTSYQNIQGQTTAQAISGPTLVKTSSGRVAVLSVTEAGTSPGIVYDTNLETTLTRPICAIQNVVAIGPVNLYCAYGIYIVPGAGQVVTVGYS